MADFLRVKKKLLPRTAKQEKVERIAMRKSLVKDDKRIRANCLKIKRVK